jgi:hypothetical protein
MAGWSAWLRARWPSPLLWCPLVSSETFPSILAKFQRDLIWFHDSYSSLTVSNLIPGKSQFTKAVEIVMLVHKTLAW